MILAVKRELKLCYRIKTMTVKTPVNYIRRRSKTSFVKDFDFEFVDFEICFMLCFEEEREKKKKKV